MIAVSRGNNAVSYGVHNIHNAVNCDVHNIYNAGCGMSSDMCNKDILHISLPAQLTVYGGNGINGCDFPDYNVH